MANEQHKSPLEGEGQAITEGSQFLEHEDKGQAPGRHRNRGPKADIRTPVDYASQNSASSIMTTIRS